jgi:hypothetical protein
MSERRGKGGGGHVFDLLVAKTRVYLLISTRQCSYITAKEYEVRSGVPDCGGGFCTSFRFVWMMFGWPTGCVTASI